MDSPKRKFSDGNVVTEEHKLALGENSLKVTDQPELNSEEARLKTYTSWPSDSAVDPARLAKSGFYYTGNDDEVVCFSCHGHVRDWQYGDIVQRKHMEFFPSCDFIHGRSSNVPLVSSKLENGKICRRLSEPAINGITLTNGIQKQLSAAESLLLNNSSKYSDYLSSANRHGNAWKCGEVKSPVTPNISSSVETLFQEMRSAEKRLRTFKNGWPVPFVDVEELANAGFFYLGSGDKVQCPFCGGVVSNWEVGDKPFAEHRRHFPFCTFLSTLVGSRPNKLAGDNSWYKGKGHDVCGHDDPVFMSSTRNENKLLDKSQEHTKLEDLGVSLHKGPAYPQQATLAARLRSFASWPSTAPVKKEELASAGFFYIGISDHTKCFHCDGGLCSWEDGDDPWVEHARWFCNCSFVRLNKGDDFIKSCVTKYSAAQSEKKDKTSASNTNHDEDDILTKTEDAMVSSMIQAVLETGLFSPYLIRAAVMRQLKETGTLFTSVDDICEAISFLQQEMEQQPPQQIEVADEKLVATLNIEMQPEVQAEEQEDEMEVGDSQVITNGLEKPVTTSKVVVPENSSQETSGGNLEEENRFLKDQRLCKVCMDSEVGVVFLPCGHLLSCTLCAPALKICPMCRKSIQATVRAYLP